MHPKKSSAILYILLNVTLIFLLYKGCTSNTLKETFTYITNPRERDYQTFAKLFFQNRDSTTVYMKMQHIPRKTLEYWMNPSMTNPIFYWLNVKSLVENGYRCRYTTWIKDSTINPTETNKEIRDANWFVSTQEKTGVLKHTYNLPTIK